MKVNKEVHIRLSGVGPRLCMVKPVLNSIIRFFLPYLRCQTHLASVRLYCPALCFIKMHEIRDACYFSFDNGISFHLIINTRLLFHSTFDNGFLKYLLFDSTD